MKRNFSNIMAITFTIFVIAIFFAINTAIPFFSDDADCTYLNGKQINNVGDIISILRFDYYNINGRILCNIAALVSILQGETFFNIANTFFFILAIILLYKTGTKQGEQFKPLTLVITIIGLLILSTGIDSLYYWASGSTNYLWALVFNMAFILLIRTYGPHTISKTRLAVLSLAAFVLALNNEMFVCPIAASLSIYCIINKRKINSTAMIIAIAYILGATVVFCAPGNFGRESQYTIGLGYATRIVKMMYCLRITYILGIVMAVLVVKKKHWLVDFIMNNAILFIMLVLSAVIPFMAASTGRSLYAIEISALIILLRLVNSVNSSKKTESICVTTLSVVFGIFYLSVCNDSFIKWNIVKKTLDKYYSSATNTVMIDDYQSKNGLVEYYTVNIDNIFMPHDKSNQYALEKSRRRNIKVNSENADDSLLIKILPENVYNKAIVNAGKFFTEANRIKGLGFYHDPSLVYSVMKYDSLKLDSIDKGYMYALYSLSFCKDIKVKVNYMEHDLGFERAAFYVDTKYGRYILLNRKFKRYPFLKLEEISLNNTLHAKKIEVSGL